MDTQSLVIVIVAAVAFAALWWLKRPDISAIRARQLVADGARLVDVRSPGEFAATHLDGARNIPVSEIGRRARELGDKAKPVIVYCASGTRSAMAKRTLKGAGFAEVYNLGSMHNW
ncbi:MAG TPA: rhodanese-like domain-containing protein [Polyangia bacterium]